MQHHGKTVPAVIIASGSGMMTLNSPGGSSLQWRAGLGLLWLTTLVLNSGVISAKARWSTPPLPSPPALPPLPLILSPLEVDSLNTARESSLGEPKPKSNLVHFGLKI